MKTSFLYMKPPLRLWTTSKSSLISPCSRANQALRRQSRPLHPFWYHLDELLDVFQFRLDQCLNPEAAKTADGCGSAPNVSKDRQIDRWIDRQTGKQTDRQTDRWIDAQMERWIGGQVDGQLASQVDRQIGRQMDRWIDGLGQDRRGEDRRGEEREDRIEEDRFDLI